MASTKLKDKRIVDEYKRLRETCCWFDFGHLAKLRLTGADRKGWLQGQVTSDLRNLFVGGFAKLCLLSPTGQIVADCDIWALGEEFFITFSDVARGASVIRLERMLILEDVLIEDLTDDFGLISVQGPDTTEILGDRIAMPRLNASHVDLGGSETSLLRSDRTGSGGWDIVFPLDKKESVASLLEGIHEAGEETWDVARIESGIPIYGKDMNERTLAMEMGSRFIDSRISFEKGCYTGQEIVERIRSRGHANRRWVGIVAESPVATADVVGQVGLITSAGVSPEFGPVAAAMIKAEAATPGGQIIISAAQGEVHGEIVEMPIRH
ncbi:MAG: YgfZ/GcvT domain-containing protein [Fimbriimonadales bacterium]